jgi:hypothetical protein
MPPQETQLTGIPKPDTWTDILPVADARRRYPHLFRVEEGRELFAETRSGRWVTLPDLIEVVTNFHDGTLIEARVRARFR